MPIHNDKQANNFIDKETLEKQFNTIGCVVLRGIGPDSKERISAFSKKKQPHAVDEKMS